MRYVIDFLKPRWAVLIFSFVALFWQYFYSFAQYNKGYFGTIREYLRFSFDLVNWQNIFVRTFSLGLIWISVAFIIFIALVCLESISIFLYNRKIEKNYVNQPKEDFAHLLRKRELSLKRHLPAHLMLSGSIMIYVFSVLIGTDYIEKIRSQILGEYFFQLQLKFSSFDINASRPQVISFFVSFLFWYLVSSLAHFLYRMSSKLHEEEKIIEEHFSAVLEN